MKRTLFLLFAIVSVAGMIATSGCKNDVTTYTVTFDANGGEGTMDTQLFTEDYEKALKANTFTREGYSFEGWNTMRDGTGTAYTDQQKIKVVADMTLYAQWKEERPVTMHNGHEYIDLGLPSGNMWATCNLGADVPEAAGNYYAWAETATKQTYTVENYPYIRLVIEGEDTLQKLTKYCSQSNFGYEGFRDELESLLAEDDAAAVNWGGQWTMPTEDDFQELINNCTVKADTINNVAGITFKGNNGNSIFLPAVRYYSDDGLADYACGYYWSSTLATDISYTDPTCAMMCRLYLEYDVADVMPWSRDCGLPVRAICNLRK
ncbi:MAG: InlB B-repeat-containing protein [Bacteroidales bacterium]|nr:InlB B-repeat-containing protein [Bacteroidales bacterium]